MFADWVLEQLEVNPNFAKQIIFSDEAHFWMNGYVNKQNCRIWNDTNPRKIHQLQMHPEKVTVWYGFDSMNILHERFEGMVISRGGNVNWSPRSCDLTPLDFFLWGYLKSQVYTNKPQTIDALKVNITNAIQQIQPDLCEKIIENWTARIRVTKRGGHLSDVIFHT